MKDRKYGAYTAVIVFSAFFFAGFYGVQCLNPCNADWLLSGGLDISQHYAGWLFFRKEAWTFPPGCFTGLSWPNAMSIIYLDSIPLCAVFFKIFQPVLPEQFQYFGWYSLICFLLQGILGVKIARKYVKSEPAAFLMGALTVMTPAFLWRTFLHVALNSHYIILLALLGIFYYQEYFAGQKWRQVWYWAMLGLLCCMVHMYFLPMCFVILCAFLYLDIRSENRAGIWQGLVMTAFWAGALIPMYFMGGFMPGMVVSDLGFQWKKTFNLNGFVNPQGWSRIFPNLALHTYGQSEGFAYLGIGVMVCILAAVFFSLMQWRTMSPKRNILVRYIKDPTLQACAAIFALSVAAAASPVVTLGSRAVTLPIPKKLEELWMIFRASGRLVWPAVYLLLFGSGVVLSRCQKRKVVVSVLTTGVILQFADISAEVWDRGRVAREPAAFVSELEDPGWDVIGRHPLIANIVYINASGLRSCASMAEFADRYDKTLGKFYYARDYEAVIAETAAQALAEKKQSDIFLFDWEYVIDAWNEPQLYYYILDERILGYVQPIAELEAARVDMRTYEYVYLYEVTPDSVGEEMIDGFLFVHGGGTDVSRVFPLPTGAYRFTVEGENLADAEVILSAGSVSERGMQNITGMINCEGMQNFQIRVENPSDHDMVLYRIRFETVDGEIAAEN